MTLAEFLQWEEGQPLRYEFDGVGPVAMVGGSVRHAQIQRNLAVALSVRLRGKPCQFLGSDLKIQTEEDHARYPDGIVICSPLTGSETIVDAPVVIFEVLSPHRSTSLGRLVVAICASFSTTGTRRRDILIAEVVGYSRIVKRSGGRNKIE